MPPMPMLGLNAWLEDRCLAYVRASSHPEMRDKVIWDVFEEERASFVPYEHVREGACGRSTHLHPQL
ncbi:hypothetical protein ETW24_02710 [Leisingera sp. NJS204]|nr:hypothetical protein ETW24_02710 [Leisingera sp. NJS204]